MDFNEFFIKIKKELLKIDITINKNQAEKFYKYMNLLIEWNSKINLTAITKPNEIIIKHFVDSLTVLKYIKKGYKIIDIGTGAGFPGIPIKILMPETTMLLVDSLNKRINFLERVIEELELKKIEAKHYRAEELGKKDLYREKFDICVSRAVADTIILSEYTLPFVKIMGKVIFMKGSNVKEEIKNSEKILEILGGKISNIDKLELPNNYGQRNLIVITKERHTPDKYPRNSGIIKKKLI